MPSQARNHPQIVLKSQNIKTETAKVKEALDRLVADGLVLEVHGRDSRTRYQICSVMRKEIADLLNETGERE